MEKSEKEIEREREKKREKYWKGSSNRPRCELDRIKRSIMAGRERGKNGFTLFNPATHKAAEAEADLSHRKTREATRTPTGLPGDEWAAFLGGFQNRRRLFRRVIDTMSRAFAALSKVIANPGDERDPWFSRRCEMRTACAIGMNDTDKR